MLQLYDYVKGSYPCASLGWVCGSLGTGPCILKLRSRWSWLGPWVRLDDVGERSLLLLLGD